MSSEVLHEVFLPYSADELRLHFVDSGLEGEDPQRHLRKWRERIAAAPSKDSSYLDRDETLWTAGALLHVHRDGQARERWGVLLSTLFGPVPPLVERTEWADLLDGELNLFFEVGLPSPLRYRHWLRDHLADRHAIEAQRLHAASRGEALEGRTHLDALLLCSHS